MTVQIVAGDPHDPAATALLKASHDLMTSLFPAESNHFLGADALAGPDIQFFVARRAEQTLGCVALADRGEYGEVKSMFVDPAGRGGGVGAALLERVESAAIEKGLNVVMLETGSKLHAAHRLYERAGFTTRGPFGGYVDCAFSVFMEKRL
ncbi:MAG: GNAT family N-acetyltransferase [Pseudomonadota bacterium]